MVRKIIWTYQAENEIYQAFLNLLKQSKSLEIANKVIDDIYQSVSVLSSSPEIYELDNLKENNEGNIRAFENIHIGYLI
jgi:hypothetical protein